MSATHTKVALIQPTLRVCPSSPPSAWEYRLEEHGRVHVVGVHNVVEAFLLGRGLAVLRQLPGAQLGPGQDSVVVVDTTTGTALAIVAG